MNRKFVTGTRGGVGKGKKIVHSKLRFVENKSVCRVRFVPLTRRSLVQASNSRRARSRRASLFLSFAINIRTYIHYCTSNLCFILFFLFLAISQMPGVSGIFKICPIGGRACCTPFINILIGDFGRLRDQCTPPRWSPS